MATLLLTLLLAAGPAEVLATFDGGVVTAAELAREEAFLTKDERTFRVVKAFSTEASRKDWIERIALRHISRRLAEAQGLTSDPAKVELARGVSRDFLLGRWRPSCYGLGLNLPSDEALAAELMPTLRPLPPRLKLSHVFLRATSPEEVRSATEELARLRAGIKTLADLQNLARERSQSGSAAKGGALGWVHKGWMQKEAEVVLYGLAPGTLSEVLPLKGGVHLFWVEDVRPEEPPPLDLLLKQQRRKLTEAALADCRKRRLIEAANRGDLGLASGAGDDERLYHLALALGVPSAEEAARMGDLENNVWLDQVVSQRVDALLGEPTPAELEARYRAAPQSFARPQRLALRRLTAPLPTGRDPLAFHDALETAVEALRAGWASWSDLTARAGPGATTETLPLTPVIDVAAFLGPAIFDRIQRLPKGAMAGPFQEESGLVVVVIDDEEAAAPLSFEEARESLVAAWTLERRRGLRGVVAARLLSEARFQLQTSDPSP